MSCGFDVAIGGCVLMQLHAHFHPIADEVAKGVLVLALLLGGRGGYLFRRLVREYDGVRRGFASRVGFVYLIDWNSPNIPLGFRAGFARLMRRYSGPTLACIAIGWLAWTYSTLPPPPPDAELLLRS